MNENPTAPDYRDVGEIISIHWGAPVSHAADVPRSSPEQLRRTLLEARCDGGGG